MNINVIRFAAVVAASISLCAGEAFADGCLQRNMPGSTEGEAKSPCGCSETGKDTATVNDDCIKIVIGLGETTPWTGSRDVALKVFADDESPMVFTPYSLYAICGYTFKRIGNTVMSDGETPKEVVFSHPNGEPVKFVFEEGGSWGRPDPGVHVPMDERLMMVDAEGWATTHDPVYWDLYMEDGRVRRYVATDMNGKRGRFVSETDPHGKVVTSEDMGIDIVYDLNGVRQLLTPSRLADVQAFRDGYDVRVYAIQDAPAKNSTSGLYPVPSSAPYRFLTVRSANGGKRVVVTLKTGESEARTYIFDYLMGDWSLKRPNGVEERKERIVADGRAAFLSKTVVSPTGDRLSRSEMNYKWESWGFAMTNKVEGFGSATRTTSWTFWTSGGGKGKVKTSLGQSGLLTSYEYDDLGRKVSETRSGPDMMTEMTTYDYTPVDASDPVLPVDNRPRTIVKNLNNIECERTYYVYSPLTNIVERVGTQGAAYGGTNVLRTVTAFYPIVANDLRSGRIASIRHEDGKLDLYDYSLVSNLWVETVTHLHEQSPSPVSGKTTRDISLTNARGETSETRTEAFIDGIWYTIARNRMTYNFEGKRTSLETLAGQVTTTAWDCCHKVSEVQPDGSTMTWDYDDEGHVIASSRLIPLDMTNVTWLTTCYEYDDLGRQTATWQTNYAAQVGLPVTRTRYDQLGRVIARVDTLGNTTMTSYSPDGRTVSVRNPNTSTVTYSRNASGDTLSIIGTAVTPEFHTYGILPDGTRWSRTVHGETASSPRFTKRYENLLAQTVREERSGFKGSVLATTHVYDSFGRLVSTVADYEPTTEYTYDTLGNRIETIRLVGGDDPGAPQPADTQWRKSESLSHIAIIDGDVWLTQTNIVSCSDSAIAPLVTSSARQLTGLIATLPARLRSFDVRGNVTETETLVDSSFVTSRQTVPYATNKPLAISRYGIVLMDVSVSAVTNTVAYDSLSRQISNTDGRGNTHHIEYNACCQRSATIDALGNRTSYAYDPFGNLASVTDPLGNATIYEYDLRGRKTYEGGATYPVRYTYDIFGNKTTMTTYRDETGGTGVSPAQGDVTTWHYDIASGSMTNKVYADGKGPSYTYTPDGKLSRRIWARGITTDYSYDNWGNLTNTVYSDGTPTIALSYDAFGRQTEARDAAGLTAFLYDSFGSLTNETIIGVAGTNSIDRFYDNFGRDTGYALNGVRQSTLGYDSATARLLSMQISRTGGSPVQDEATFSWSYLPGSDLKSSLAYPNGLTSSWQYDANGQLLQVCNAFTTNVISQYDYTYDAAGRRVGCGKSGSAFAQTDTISYAYNNRSELTNAVAVVDSDYRYAYDFDDIGNRETSSERGTNSVYTANQLNQYTAVDDFAPQFDDDGNQTLIKTSTGIWSVTYNGENRPILWSCIQTNNSNNPNNQTILSMSYDRMGRRVTKNAQRFVYNGYLQIANFELQTSNLVLQTFIWDPVETVATRPLAWNRDTFVSYYTHDGNKNVSEVVTGNGETAIHYEFAPFGAVVRFSGVLAGANPWRFSSEYADDALGVVYYNYRYYDPVVGRWMSMDPLSELGGVNLYSMLWNGIVDITDFLGLGEAESSCSDFVIYINPVYGYKDVVAGTSVSAPGAPVPMTKEWGVISSDGVVLVRVCYDSYCDSRGEPHIDNMQVAASDVVGSLDELDISVSGFLPKVVDKRLKKMGVELDLTLSGGWSIEAGFGRQETTGDHCVEKSATLRVYFKTIEVVGSFSVGKSFGDTRVSGGGSKKLIAIKELKATKEVNFKFCCCKKVTYEKDKVIETTEGTMVTTER